MRGFNLDHGTDIDITLEDMPVNMRTHGHGQGYADLNFIIPELISTLHYSKGPYFPDLRDFDTAGGYRSIMWTFFRTTWRWSPPARSAIIEESRGCRVRWAPAICWQRRNTTPGRPSQRKGIELTASYKPLPWLRLDGDFAATHARFANGDDGAAADTEPGHPGNYIPGAANMIASASATVEDLGPWFGALRFRYFGRRPLIEDNSVISKPTTLVDLRIGYRLSEQARLWLDILNLFNNTGAR